MIFILALLLIASSVSAAISVGNEALLSLPSSAKYNLILNDRPRDGETVYLNPPRISWSYTPNPTNAATDLQVKEFQFQAAYTADFASPAVNVRTKMNCWNYTAPFTTNVTVYWRVFYIGTNGLTNATGDTHTFTVATGCTNWDRSMLSDTNYWNTNAVHPRIMFNAGNRLSLSNWLNTNAAWLAHWQQQTTWAYSSILATNWTMPDPTVYGPLGANGIDWGTWGQNVYRVAFVYQMTGDPRFVAEPTNVCKRANDLATFVRTNNFEYRDQTTYSSQDLLKGVFLSYDWLYTNLTTLQKSNLLYVIERCSQFDLYGSTILRGPNGPGVIEYTETPFAQITNGYYTEFYSVHKRGQNHPITWLFNHAIGALAAYEDGAYSRDLLEQFLNLQISRTFQFGDDGHAGAGRGYNRDFLYGGDMLLWNIMASTVFPQAQLNKNPFWIELSDWQQRMSPVGFWERYDPWGDLGGGSYLLTPSWPSDSMDIAAFTSNGTARLYYDNAVGYFGEAAFWRTTPNLPITFHYHLPASETNTIKAKAFPYGGWVMGSTYEPNTIRGWRDGVGFIIRGSPQGYMGQHDNPCDLDVQMWAYGAPITESGYGFNLQSKIGWMKNVPAFNGLSLFNGYPPPYDGYASKIMAFTNSSTFTYAAIDGTGSYPIKSYPDSGGQTMPGTYATSHNQGQASALTKMHRHLLFMREKYFVIYDAMASTTNSIFSWIWQIPDPGIVVSNKSFTYLSTNTSTGSNITVQVSHVVESSLLTITNLAGTNLTCVNPVSGSNYFTGDIIPRPNAIWINNASTSTNWHFMSVIYPYTTGMTAPTITRIDDNTVAVTNGVDGDVISFDTNRTDVATLIIDLGSVQSSPETSRGTIVVRTLNIGPQ